MGFRAGLLALWKQMCIGVCPSVSLLQINIIFINNMLNFSMSSSFVYLFYEVHTMISSFAAQS